MAVLNDGETNYPAEIDQYVTERDSQSAGRTLARAAPIMGALKAIRAIQQQLGYGTTKPAGDDTSLGVRLAKRLFPIRIHGSGGFTSIQDAINNGGSVEKPGLVGILPDLDGNPSETVSEPITLGDNTALMGALGASKIKQEKTSSSSKPVIENADLVGGNQKVDVHGIEIDGNADTANGTEWDHGVQWKYVTRGILAGCYIHDPAGDGVYISGGQQHIIRNLWIKVPHLQDSPWIGRNGIAIVDGKKVVIEGCVIMGGQPACIDLEPNAGQDIDEVIIRGNILSGKDENGTALTANGYGIMINQSNGHIRKLVITDNIIVDTAADGIGLLGYANEDSSDLLSDVVIANNVLYNVNYTGGGREGGISVANQGRRIVVANNVVYGAGKYGIFIYQHDAGTGKVANSLAIVGNIVENSAYHGIFYYSESSDNQGEATVIANNVSANNGQDVSSGNVFYGILLMRLQKAVVTGNIAYDNQATATQARGFTLEYCNRVLFDQTNHAYGNIYYQVFFYNCTDVRDGSVRSYHYIAPSITADGTNRTMYPDKDITVSRDWKVPMGGWVIGIRAVIQDAVTGNINVYPTINGSVKSGVAVTLNAGQTSAASQRSGDQHVSGYELSEGDRVGAVYNAESGGNFTAPVVAEVIVAHTL